MSQRSTASTRRPCRPPSLSLDAERHALCPSTQLFLELQNSPGRLPALLQDFSHIVFPLSDTRSELPGATPEKNLYWATVNIPAYNQNRGAKKGSEVSKPPTTRSVRKKKLLDTTAESRVQPLRPRLRPRAFTPLAIVFSPPSSPASSDLSSIDESILAHTRSIRRRRVRSNHELSKSGFRSTTPSSKTINRTQIGRLHRVCQCNTPYLRLFCCCQPPT